MHHFSTRTEQRHSPAQASLLSSALESVANAIFITDRAGRIVWTNPAFSQLCGYSQEELSGNTPAMLNSGQQSPAFYAELWHTVLSGKVWRGIVVDRKKDGSFYTVDETITPLFDAHGAITHFIAIQQDLSLQNRQQEQDHYLAYHDDLTGLPNRACFLDLQRQAMLHADYSHDMLALLFLDLDKFKPVNDTFGHETGDRLLQAVAERLKAAIRKSDTVARIGGDEFALLLPNLNSLDIVVTLACKLIITLSQPFTIEAHKLQLGASIGIAIYPDDGQTQGDLLRKADQAMYAAKHHGGSGYRFYGNLF